jgi:hypothetical protein
MFKALEGAPKPKSGGKLITILRIFADLPKILFED